MTVAKVAIGGVVPAASATGNEIHDSARHVAGQQAISATRKHCDIGSNFELIFCEHIEEVEKDKWLWTGPSGGFKKVVGSSVDYIVEDDVTT